MRHLDRSTHELYAACAIGKLAEPTPMFDLLSQIADMRVVPVDFGPESLRVMLKGKWRDKARSVLETARAVCELLRLAAFVRRQHVEVIHTDERPRDAFACVLLGRLTGAKSIVQVHFGYGEWMSPLLKWSLKRADALVAVSQFVERSLISSGRPRTRLRVVVNGIDLANWKPGEGRLAARREFAVRDGAPVLISVCRLGPGKGPGELVASLPSIRREFPDVRLLIVGDDSDVAYRQHLEELASDLGVAENVVLTGRRNDVARLMAAADIYAMPSQGDACPLVFLEAMAMELPVVALDSGGAPELIQDGATGLLSEPGDAACLTEHLLALIRDPGRRATMGAAGRRRVESCFAAPRMASDIAEVYQWLLADTPRRDGRRQPRSSALATRAGPYAPRVSQRTTRSL
jgi:glycosyltransferase involved in cell wall biosynthesis